MRFSDVISTFLCVIALKIKVGILHRPKLHHLNRDDSMADLLRRFVF